MRRAWFLALALLCGCSTVSVGNYIKSEHPYSKKIYGDYDKILQTIKDVLASHHYRVVSESYPSVYERATDEHKETPKDVLLFTEIKQHSMVLFSSYTHLNVFVHSVADGAEVEVRYGKVTSLLFKQLSSTRNDALGNKILDQVEHAMLVQ